MAVFFQFIINAFAFLAKILRFRSIGNMLIKKAFIFPIAALETALVAILSVYFVCLVRILLFIFLKINSLIKLINDFQASNDDVISLACDVIKSLGLWDAFVSVWNIYSGIFITLFIVFGSTIGINFFNFFRRRLYEYYHMARI